MMFTVLQINVFSSYLSHNVIKPVFEVSDTNQTVQPQKMIRGLKFQNWEVEGKEKH